MKAGDLVMWHKGNMKGIVLGIYRGLGITEHWAEVYWFDGAIGNYQSYNIKTISEA
jgi:hypothetical protein